MPAVKLTVLDPFRQDLEKIHPSLRLCVSARARRMALRVDPKTGLINLVMPQRASLKKVLQFARDQQEWINHHAVAIPQPVYLTEGTVISVLGRERVIRINRDSTLRRTTIRLTADEIQVSTNQDDPGMRITRFLRNLARDEITILAEEKAASIGKSISQINIRDTTSRWGSCSTDGKLSFSWRIILAPAASMDYIVAHEVSHLVYMNHQARFWALCESLSKDYTAGRQWMRSNGSTLMRYR